MESPKSSSSTARSHCPVCREKQQFAVVSPMSPRLAQCPRGWPATRTTFSAVSSSREDRSKPVRDGLLEMTQLPVIESSHLTVRDIQVAVVVNQDMR